MLSKNIKNLSIKDIKKNFNAIKKNAKYKKVKIPKKFISFKRLINSDNFNRFKCIFLPVDAVLKALKLWKKYSLFYLCSVFFQKL